MKNSQERHQGGDNVALDKIPYFKQRGGNGLPFERIVAERYTHVGINTVLDAYVCLKGRVKPNSGYFRIIINDPRFMCEFTVDTMIGGSEHFDTRGTDMERPVLVDIREFGQHPQGVIHERPAEIVGLHPLYDVLRPRVDALDLILQGVIPSLRHYTGYCGLAAYDRELRAFCFHWRESLGLGVGLGQTEGQVIETASQILDDIADDERVRISGNLIGGELEEIITKLIGVGVNREGVMFFSIKPFHDVTFQLIQEFARPSQFVLEAV